jgi:hypothetical protein
MQRILWFCFLCVEVINLASQTPHTTSARGSIQSPHFLSDISATYTGHVNTMFATHAQTQNETIYTQHSMNSYYRLEYCTAASQDLTFLHPPVERFASH